MVEEEGGREAAGGGREGEGAANGGPSQPATLPLLSPFPLPPLRHLIPASTSLTHPCRHDTL